MVNCDKNDKLRKVLFYPIRSRHNGVLNFKNIDNLIYIKKYLLHCKVIIKIIKYFVNKVKIIKFLFYK